MNGLTVTDAELVILKDWLRGLKQAKPAVWTGDVDKGVIGCAGCHGDENQGIDGDGPSLVANFNWDHVRNGKGSEMPAYSAEELSDAELASIVRWKITDTSPRTLAHGTLKVLKACGVVVLVTKAVTVAN